MILRNASRQLTVLDNGIRVATTSQASHFYALGVFVRAGSQKETTTTTGASLLIDKMAYSSTAEFDRNDLMRSLEELGGAIQTNAAREYQAYSSLIFRKDLRRMAKLLSEMVLKPKYNTEELNEVKDNLAWEINLQQWQYQVTSPEYLHALAYRSEASRNIIKNFTPFESEKLGKQLVLTKEQLDKVTPEMLMLFRRKWFTNDRLVVCGVGIPHQDLVDLVSEYFPSQPTPAIFTNNELSDDLPKYTGGTRIVDTTYMPPSPNPDDMHLSHISIAFEAMHVNDPDIYSLATLSSLLGGGGSFSAGGPGKGMYSRLYTNVLNRCGWVEQINNINHNYQHSSLFGISASVPPDERTHQHIIPTIADQLLQLTTKVSDEEFKRSKNQLKSTMLMGLESQMSQLEDLGRQVMFFSKKFPEEQHSLNRVVDVVEVCKRIDMITKDDLVRTARRVLLGEKMKSAYEFPGSTHWEQSELGEGRPAILIQAPIFGDRDGFLKVEDTLKTWGLMGPLCSKRKSSWF